MKTKLLSLATLAMLLLGIFAVLPVHAQVTSITLTPNPLNFDTSTTSVGDKFNVTVHITTDTDLGGAQIYMTYDDSLINATRWIPLTSDPSYFMPSPDSELPAPPADGYTHLGPGSAAIQVAISKGGLPPAAPWGHSGVFANIEFVILQQPGKFATLTCTIGINNANTYLLDTSSNTIPNTSKFDDVYTYTWMAPTTKPAMGLNSIADANGHTVTYIPDGYSFDQYTNDVGQTLFVDCVINSLSGSWALTAASFRLTFDNTVVDIVGGVADITVNSQWGPYTLTVGVGTVDFTGAWAGPPTPPSGSVLVLHIKFTVMNQNVFPGANLYSDLTYSNIDLEDHVGPIPYDAPQAGRITVPAFQNLSPISFEVSPNDIVINPHGDPAIGKTFCVDVLVHGLTQNHKLIGVQFRLYYDPTLLSVTSISEGPFLQDPTWDLYGTFFYSSVELPPPLPQHVLVADLLLPNGTGYYDQTTFPETDGVVATICFKVIKQECPNNFTCPLTLGDVFGEWAIDVNGNYLRTNTTANINGQYTVLPFSTPGRVIDVYGGAVNDGYGVLVGAPYYQFPFPYGGQNAWPYTVAPFHYIDPNNVFFDMTDRDVNGWVNGAMDEVFPQSQYYFWANLTYNYWPVQSKQVGFELQGPYEQLDNGTLVPKQRFQLWAKFTATTDSNGVAGISYRMPWPCDDPDGITGVYVLTASATVADVPIKDVLVFYYERPVYLTSVTTDSFYYTHTQLVKVTVCWETHAVQSYPALFAIVATDDLGVPFAYALHYETVGGGAFCVWNSSCFEVDLYIPKWAYAGYGHIHVSCYDKDPTEGGFAWCPEFSPAPEIQIGPY